MNYPLVLSNHKRIVIAPDGWFALIGRIDPDKRTVEIAISRLGQKSLAWFIDATRMACSFLSSGKASAGSR